MSLRRRLLPLLAVVVPLAAHADAPRLSEGLRHIAEGERAFEHGGDHATLVRAAQALLVRADSGAVSAIEDRKRAHAFGKKVFSQLPGFDGLDAEDIAQLVERLETAKQLPSGVAHVTVTSFCTLIPTLSIFSQLGAARTCRRGLELTSRLDAGYEHGAPIRALAMFQLRSPAIVGGDVKAALQLAERVIAIHRDFAPNRLVYAKARFAIDKDEAAWRQRLLEITGLPDDGVPDAIDHQRRAKDEAQRRLSDGDTKP